MVKRLLYINGLAIINVILFHASGMGFVAMFAWGNRYLPADVSPLSQVGNLPYYGLRFLEQLASLSIPAFLIVSGYFVAVATSRTQKTIGINVVISRVIHLLIPYLIWSAVAIGLKVILENRPISVTSLARMLLTGSTNEVFYFVPLLTQFYLLSPIFILLARRNWKMLLLVTGMLQLMIQASQYPLMLGHPVAFSQQILSLAPKWFFFYRIFWFPLGIVMGFQVANFKRLLYPLRWWLVSAAAVIIPLGMAEWEFFYRMSGQDWLSNRETVLDNLYALCLVLGLLGFERANFPLFSQVSWLGGKSYGIYLVHAIVIETLAKGIYHLFPWMLGYQSLLQPAFILSGLGIPLLLMVLMDKSFLRRFYSYVFG